MDQSEAQATNGGHIIEMQGGAQAVYLSEKIGRDFGHPLGGWTAERDQATEYAPERANEIISKHFATEQHLCKVVPK